MAAELALTVPIGSSVPDHTMTFSSNIMSANSNQYDELRTKTSAFLREFDTWIASKKHEYVQSREHRQRWVMVNSGMQSVDIKYRRFTLCVSIIRPSRKDDQAARLLCSKGS